MLGVSISVYYFSSLERAQIFKKRLTSRANNAAQIFSYFGDSSTNILNRINVSTLDPLLRKSVEIYNLKGKLYYAYSSEEHDTIGITDQVLNETIQSSQYFYDVRGREALAIRYAEENIPDIIVIVAGYDQDGWIQLRQLKQIFVIALLVGIAVTLAAGHLFSKRLLKPVAQIIEEVNDISSHNLSHRIRTGETQDELNQLASTFNDLLDRLQESFNSQRRFISNASHELSTPLTSISSQLQVALQRERNTEEYRQVMQSVQEDVVQMRELTKSLLEIAKTGSEGNIVLDEIRIDEVLFKVMSDIKKANHSYQVELNFIDSPDVEDYGFLVFGNSDLLYIAIKNIVENGCKYSTDNISRVNLSFSKTSTIIEVKSFGEPIAREEMQRIFQPFYRSTNSVGKSGFGLGLALAKRIVGIHKGSLEVKSDIENGTDFVVTLPTFKRKQ